MRDDRNEDAEAERMLTQLFAHAQPRPMPPADDTEEIRRAVLAEWDAVTGRRVFVRRAGFAAAASVLLAVGLFVGGAFDPAAPPPAVARVERVLGPAAGLALGGVLAVGDEVATGAGQVALRLATGGSLRIGPDSRVVLAGADAAELVAGVMYFDSEGERPGADFLVTTVLGTVRDVGTQFLVKLDDARGELDVGVRDGRVVLTRDGESDTARVGERLVTTQDSSAIRRDALATFGSEWDWAEKLAPPFDINGRTVSDFLAWFEAQTGRSVVFATPAAERLAQETTLNGSIDLEPLQKLSAVLALTDLTYTLEDGRVVISTR